jgi:methylthioribose-1-phosphate isomerase
MPAAHPAFDVTPARYVTAIVTEEGVHRPPFEESLRFASQAKAGAPASGRPPLEQRRDRDV